MSVNNFVHASQYKSDKKIAEMFNKVCNCRQAQEIKIVTKIIVKELKAKK